MNEYNNCSQPTTGGHKITMRTPHPPIKCPLHSTPPCHPLTLKYSFPTILYYHPSPLALDIHINPLSQHKHTHKSQLQPKKKKGK